MRPQILSMKAAMYYSNSDLRLVEMPEPRISGGEILLKVMASGICGSDVMEWYRKKRAPLVLGHEVAGEVAAVGRGVSGFRRGDRIAATHHVPCYSCHYCKSGRETMCPTMSKTSFDPGGFAEYLRIPPINVKSGCLKLPAALSYDEATFIEPLGCVVRGQRAAGVCEGDTVLVIGSGITGLLHMQLAAASGAAKVLATDISPYRLKAAERFGAAKALDARGDVPLKVRELNGGRPADVVIVCTGALKAMEQALKSVDRGGTVLFFAPSDPGVDLPVPVCDVWKDGVSLVTSYAAARDDLAEALRLLAGGKIDAKGMVTHRLPLGETGRGFGLVAGGGESMKVIIRPHG